MSAQDLFNNKWDNKRIELTVKSICIYLITDYIKKENVEELCTKTPNFNIYYTD